MSYPKLSTNPVTTIIGVINKPLELWVDTWYRRAQLRLYLGERKYPKYDAPKKALKAKILRDMEDDAFSLRQDLWAGFKTAYPAIDYKAFYEVFRKEVHKKKEQLFEDLK